MATNRSLKEVKEQLISGYDDLIQQLETLYMNFINKLLMQKKQIMCKMQQLFHQQMQKIHNLQKTNTSKIKLDPTLINKLLASLLPETSNTNSNKPPIKNVQKTEPIATQYLGNQNINITNIQLSDIVSNNNQRTSVSSVPKATSTQTNRHHYNPHMAYHNRNILNNDRSVHIQNIVTNNNPFHVNRPVKVSRQTQTSSFDFGVLDAVTLIKNYSTVLTPTTTQKQSYKCNQCGKLYKHLCNLKTHQKIHTDKCYVCEHCQKRFGRKYNYVEHLRTHTGEAPFACGFCQKRFKQKHGWKNHIKKIHKLESIISESLFPLP